jgi:hypothetical protein
MLNLTAAAQSVLDAYRDESWTPDEEDNSGYYKFSHRAGMAAALRAVASQFDRPKRSDAHALWNEGFQHAQRVCRADLLNIADELEAQ